MNDLLQNIEVPEVPIMIEFDNQSLFNMGLTLIISAIIITLVFRHLNK